MIKNEVAYIEFEKWHLGTGEGDAVCSNNKQ